MVDFFLRIYDCFRKHRKGMYVVLAVLCAAFAVGALNLGHNEDILDFLPVGKSHRKAMNIYQNLSAADQIIAIVQYSDIAETDPYMLTEVVDSFTGRVRELDSLGILDKITTQIDYESIYEVSDFIYSNIPYFLTEEDYVRLDSILTDEYVAKQVSADKMMLMFPTGSMLSDYLQQDPLNLFTPIVQKLQNYQSGIRYESYDDYILTPDMKKAIVMMKSPFGSNETNNNGKLVNLLHKAADRTEADFTNIEIHLSGAPVYAVTNATRIKKDSIISIAIAIVLILALLLYAFRSLKSLLQIGLSVAFGWLCAMGLMGMIRDEVSMIILGIASIIIGIAVNYPIHLLDHLRHDNNIRNVLKEVVSPLVIGNITTVGAFLCLVPMSAPALRDFGLFALFMLVGTVVFVLLFMPHMIKRKPVTTAEAKQDSAAWVSGRNHKWIIALIAACTVVFAYFSQFTSFDTNMHNINYMTEEQREDMASFQEILNAGTLTPIYIASEGETWEDALEKSEKARGILLRISEEKPMSRFRSATPYLPSKEEQKRRLDNWYEFVGKHRRQLVDVFHDELEANGFHRNAFGVFDSLVNQKFSLKEWEDFELLASSLFSGYLSKDDGLFTIIDFLDVEPERVAEVKAELDVELPELYNFDVQGMNGALATSLSDDFNRICFSCGIIVFIFLWIAFGRIELSILAFLPMAISWIWILGIMQLTGIQFNIVNIILATFIFGQGDDYTIFMTDGLIYEYAYGRKLLKSYKHSIMLSALIMLVGIGSLIIAKHPAMHSLAEVTIIGMFSVVIMTYLIPPFCYNLITRDRNGNPRVIPVTIKNLFRTLVYQLRWFIQIIVATGIRIFTFGNTKTLRRYAKTCAEHTLHISGMGGLSYDYAAKYHSDLDVLVLLACGDGNLIIVTQRKLHLLLRCLLTLTKTLRSEVTGDTHIGVFVDEMPEAGFQVYPLAIHGSNYILPEGGRIFGTGSISVRILDESSDYTCAEDIISSAEETLAKGIENAGFFKNQVIGRYLYKGKNIERTAIRELAASDCFSKWINAEMDCREVVVLNNGQGVFGLLMALIHKDIKVYAIEEDIDKFDISRNLAGIPDNLTILNSVEALNGAGASAQWYVINPTEEQKNTLSNYIEVV